MHRAQSIVKQMMLIAVAGLLVGILINMLHPSPLPWRGNWENRVETRARAAGIEVVPLSRALALHRAGTHLFVDARRKAEYRPGHVAGAVSCAVAAAEEHPAMLVQLLESRRPLIVYCSNRECDDALLLALELRRMGRDDILYYVDGFQLWREQGCPVEQE